jgi:hypothetical protein
MVRLRRSRRKSSGVSRPYTGTKGGAAAGKRAGLEEFVRQITAMSDGALWNNGTWVVRNMRGKESLSVHATGRAVDLSYRKLGNKGKPNGRKHAEGVMEFLVANWKPLHIECILDYFPQPHGRGWRCDRVAWQNYTSKTISGAPGGDWIHVEISPKFADNAEAYKRKFARLLAGQPDEADDD